MSVIFANDDGWLISHEEYINNIYKNVASDNGSLALKIKSGLFSINSRFSRGNRIKRKNVSTDSEENIMQHEAQTVEKLYRKMVEQARNESLIADEIPKDGNKEAMSVRLEIFENAPHNNIGNSHGCNSTENALISKIGLQDFVFPRNSCFYSHDIRDFNVRYKFDEMFDFVLVDPPWWNKSVRRKKRKLAKDSYSMMYNQEVSEIPMKEILKENAIVAVWCTNSQSCLDSILHKMFPAWDIHFMAKWYWVKITQTGDTICDFNEKNGKQPFELVIIGSKSKSIKVPNEKIIMSIPSVIHSHKPPLADIFSSFLPKDPQCMEIFARYLLPGWTSWGLEVLKFQQLSMFTKEFDKLKCMKQKNQM